MHVPIDFLLVSGEVPDGHTACKHKVLARNQESGAPKETKYVIPPNYEIDTKLNGYVMDI